MLKRNNTMLMAVFFCVDVLLSMGALFAADWLRHNLTLGRPITVGTVYLDSSSYLAMMLICFVVFRCSPFYSSRRTSRLMDEIMAVARAALLICLVFAAWLFFSGNQGFSRLLLFYFIVINLLALIGFHVFLRISLRFLRVRRFNQKKMLVIGAGKAGTAVVRSVLEHPWAGFQVVGFLDDAPDKQARIIAGGVSVRGRLADAVRVVKEEQVDEVVIALPAQAHHRLVEVVELLRDEPVNIRVVPDLLTITTIRAQIEDLWGIPVVGIRYPVLSATDAAMKRLGDLIGASAALLLFAPVMVVAAILVKIDSEGPVFFVQKRVGENGRVFRMIKFRTMVSEAESMLDRYVKLNELPEPVFKIKNDPRVTKIGRLLRRFSIDELPQLINVLKGDMSLVGPRPEEVRIVREYSQWHRQRLVVKPGMTGPMQVSGRGDLSLKERVELELLYILEYSLWKDVKILLQTVLAVFRQTGSY